MYDVYCLTLHSVYNYVPILLCISILSSSFLNCSVLFCSAHACSIPIIQYANHCTVRYGTSRRPHCPLQAPPPSVTNGKPVYADSAQEPMPSHGTGNRTDNSIEYGVVEEETRRRSRRWKVVEKYRFESEHDSRPFQAKPSNPALSLRQPDWLCFTPETQSEPRNLLRSRKQLHSGR